MKNNLLMAVTLFFCGANLNATTYEIDELVSELLYLTDVPGAAVGILVDNEIVVSKGYGTRNIEEGLPVTNKTLFQVGSITKGFTSFLIGQLVEEGLMDWDDPITNHIPHFKLKDPYTTYNITIRDYLTHVSGYPCHDAVWYNERFSRESLMKRLSFLEPIYALREKFLYQQLGYAIVGHAAEKVTQKPYETLIAERIFHPLGMRHSTFSLADMQKSSNFSIGYREPPIPTPTIDPHTIAPAGGIHSNIEDLLKWVKVLLQKGDGLIEPHTFNEITTPQVVSDLICNGKYGSENELLMESYGLGWILISYRGHFAILHGGNIDGFSSVLLILPKEQIGIVVLCNNHFSPFPPILTALLMDKLLGLPPIDWIGKYKAITENQVKEVPQKPIVTKLSHPISDYQGTYTNPGYGTLGIKLENNKLIATLNHMSMPLNHLYYNVFEVSNEAFLPAIRKFKFVFQENNYGDISFFSIALEPQAKGVIFMKQKDEALVQKEYLDKFAGNYSYLGFTFVIDNSEKFLTVKAFGQPPYELLPERNNLFKVKGLEGYTVQFLTDESGTITTIQLIQPNNSIITAHRKL